MSSLFATPKRYGQRFVISLIPGDGVGREVCLAVQKVFDAANVPIDWEEVLVSGHDDVGTRTFFTPRGVGEHTSYNLAIRKALNLYANVVHVRSLPGIPTRHEHPMDAVIIRENTEGEYSNLEHEPQPGVVESLKVVTRAKSEDIIRFAFDYAVLHGRKKITCLNKANIMKLTDGQFLRTFRRVADEYAHTGLALDEMIVDNAAMQMVSRPSQFDVIVTPNLYGNIMSNIGAALVGSAGLLPGYSIGPEYATFEPGARHTAKDIAGKDAANPISMLLSGVLMLRHLGLARHAEGIEAAVLSITREGPRSLTKDITGGASSTTAFVDRVVSRLQ